MGCCAPTRENQPTRLRGVMPLTSIFRAPDGRIQQDLPLESLRAARETAGGLLWVHARSVTSAEADTLSAAFDIHPLALHDLMNAEYEAPKVDEYAGFLFVKLHGVDHGATDELVRTTELDVLIGPNWAVSGSHSELPAIDHLLATLPESPRPLERGSDMLAHVIIDALVDSILPTIHQMDDFADEVEVRALERPQRALLADILRLKRSAMSVHRIVVPQREVLYRLARGEYEIISREAGLYFRDVYDHLVRVEDLVLSSRDRAEGALTTYLSAVNIRQNETMRILAIVTSVFLPLTLLTGIYGMNFEHMPELGWTWTYPLILAVIVVTVSGVTLWLFGRYFLDRARDVVRLTFRVEQRLLNQAIEEAARLRDAVTDATRDR